jgi:hypothetical protein
LIQQRAAQGHYWQRLDKPAALTVLSTVSAEIDPGLFPAIATEVKCQPLSFCRDFMLYRLTNLSALPAFTMDFLSNGEVFYYLSGAAEPIYRANERGPLTLREDNVMAYLDFFFTHVKSEDGDIYVVRDPAHLPFMSSLPLQQREELNAHHNQATVRYDALKDSYDVCTTLYYAGGLMRACLEVSSSGEIDFKDLSLLLSNMAPYFETRSPEDYYVRA